jgi:hypothetical protein
MDECQGTTINDMSGNNMTGTLTIGGTGGNTTGEHAQAQELGLMESLVKNYSIDLMGQMIILVIDVIFLTEQNLQR